MVRQLAAALFALVLSLSAAACGGGPTPGPGPQFDFGPPKDPGVSDDTGGPADAGGEDVGPSGDPSVVMLGLDGLPGGIDVACGGEQVLTARAQHIGGRVLRPFVTIAQKTYPFDVAPVADPADPEVFRFTVDFTCLRQGEACDPANPTAGPNLADGASLAVGVAAFADATLESLPTEAGLSDSSTVPFDSAAPTLELIDPSPLFLPITVAGLTPFVGKARDARLLGGLDVYFAGVLVATFEPPEGSGKSWDFGVTADFSDAQTGFDTLSVVLRDTCGNEATFETEARVVKWPRLRSFERTTLPGKSVVIDDSALTDWNEDGYPDVVYATVTGIVLALNAGADAVVGGPGATGRFPEMRKLTSVRTAALAPIDVDVDGHMDMAAIENRSGGYWLVIYRNLGDGVLSGDEMHLLDINSSTKVVDMVVADFSENSALAPDGLPRDDIVVATDSEAEAILMFKRQIPEDAPSDFDQCKQQTVQVDGGADGQGTTAMVCPTLFADAVKSGGISNITQIEAWDVSGVQEPGPDGFPDLIIGADALNQVVVYGNRFPITNKLDTAFSASTISYVWPESEDSQQRAKFFCLGQFIKTGEPPEDDPMDIVAGVDKSGTWRVLRGVGGGKFINGKQSADDPWDPWNYVGTTGNEITSLACGDFNGDGNDDFAIMSKQTLLMQVLLGNGKGRFNQVGPGHCDPNNAGCQSVSLLNPVNEAIGFVTDRDAQNPHVADFDKDGKPDILVDYRLGTTGLFMNATDCAPGQCGAGDFGFDLVATRTLRTPLDLTTSTAGGMLSIMAIGDLTGDGKDDLIAARPTTTQPSPDWLKIYHPNGQAYHKFYGTGGKNFPGYLLNVWSPGTYGPHLPSYPAAYDHITAESYGEYHGAVNGEALQLHDLVGADGSLGPDGHLDLVFGGKKGAVIDSAVGLLRNLNVDFWDPAKLANGTQTMFYPHPGALDLSATIGGFGLINPAGTVMPSVVVGVQRYTGEPTSIPWTARVCNWNANLEPAPYWDCPKFGLLQDSYGKEIGGVTTDLKRIAIEGPMAGQATEDPNVAADVIILNGITRSITYFPWDGTDPSFPYDAPVEKAIGRAPETITFDDLDNDGNLDFAAVVFRNVFVAFGQDALDPFEAPLPVDKDPSVEQLGPAGVATTDINHDGLVDVVFTERTLNAVKIYLNIGADDANTTGLRKFHGPITLPMCKLPSQILAHNFDPAGNNCEDLVVLCDGAGAIAIMRNESAGCAK